MWPDWEPFVFGGALWMLHVCKNNQLRSKGVRHLFFFFFLIVQLRNESFLEERDTLLVSYYRTWPVKLPHLTSELETRRQIIAAFQVSGKVFFLVFTKGPTYCNKAVWYTCKMHCVWSCPSTVIAITWYEPFPLTPKGYVWHPEILLYVSASPSQ